MKQVTSMKHNSFPEEYNTLKEREDINVQFTSGSY